MELFLCVLDEGSILRAAENKGIAQPALSRRLRSLESRLGVPLLNRSSQGVSATPYGEIFARNARLILQNRNAAIEEIKSFGRGLFGHLRIGAAPTLSHVLPTAISGLSKKHPDLTFDIVEGTYQVLLHKIRNGEIDGAFTLLPEFAETGGLESTVISNDQVHVVCSTTHPMVGKRRLTFADIKDEPWAIFSQSDSRESDFSLVMKSHSIKNPKVVVRTASLDFLKSLVTQGHYLTMLPEGAVKREIKLNILATLSIQETLPAVPLVFIHRKEVLPPIMERVLQQVTRILGI